MYYGDECVKFGSRQSSRSRWNSICWNNHCMGRGNRIQYLTSCERSCRVRLLCIVHSAFLCTICECNQCVSLAVGLMCHVILSFSAFTLIFGDRVDIWSAKHFVLTIPVSSLWRCSLKLGNYGIICQLSTNQGSHASLKVFEFSSSIFQAFKVLENRVGALKVLESEFLGP